MYFVLAGTPVEVLYQLFDGQDTRIRLGHQRLVLSSNLSRVCLVSLVLSVFAGVRSVVEAF